MKRIGILLSGCGVYDGAEIHEAVLTLVAVELAQAQAVCLAPDIEQAHVVDHLTGEVVKGERRNVLREAARIARGKIRSTADISVGELDALILVGGYGAAKNLTDFAFSQGGPLEIEPSVAKLVRAMFAARKPLGFLCVSPVVAAAVLGGEGIELTVGDDAATSAAIEGMGAKHVAKTVADIHCDPNHPVVSTPAYMLGQSLSEIAAGIDKLVAEVVRLTA
jgi:enhancing lycopene biosynthesis protein 2